ncbi:disulfide bond formation protein B [Indioceanicola profundi]|uniref:disulfide bond formation protein B n=1 Tax=Indioceanicola profundi TaxID=2220096 RepID=UPI000E6ABD1A|nr:disulfide bond formation protein B [Indioceanicola profundi]
MSSTARLLAAPRLAPALLIGACLAALGTALFAQYVGGLPPCELCIWQRWAYAAAIALLLPGLFLGGRPAARAVVLTLGGLAFLAGAGISLFHAGVEQGWWQGLSGCSASFNPSGSLEDLRAQIFAAPIAKCDEIPWSLFGLSIAGWNALASLALAGLAFAAAWATARRRRHC